MLLRISLRELAPENADDLAALEQGQIERQFGNAGGETDRQVPSGPSDGAQRRLAVITAHRIVNDMCALRAASRLEPVGERARGILVERAFGILHALIRAVLARQCQLFLT